MPDALPPDVERGSQVNAEQEEHARPGQAKTTFGLKKGPRRQPRTTNPYDYEQKYEEDAYGEELNPNARFWRVLLDEGQVYDTEMIEGWRDTLDVLLVFAGLFSAVVTTFVVQSSTALRSDYAQISANLLVELIAIQRAWASGLPIDSIPPSQVSIDVVTSSALDHWCNGFWFTSLALSLSAALMAVLVKQWLQAYNSNVSGTPKHQALVRQFRLLGVERWNVPLIVGLLPMLLHLSLLLFFVGLSLYVIALDTTIAAVVIGIAATAYSLFIVANILPMVDCQCPYKSPLSQLVYISLQYILNSTLEWLRGCAGDRPDVLPQTSPSPAPSRWASVASRILSAIYSTSAQPLTARPREAAAVTKREDKLMVECLNWVYSTSSNPTVINITAQAVSGLPHDVARISHSEMRDGLLERLSLRVSQYYGNRDPEELRGIERLARGLLFFDIDGDYVNWRLVNVLSKLYDSLLGCDGAFSSELEGVLLALHKHEQGEDRPPFEFTFLDRWARLLPFRNSSPTALQLPPAVWNAMFQFVAHGTSHISNEPRAQLALFLLVAYADDAPGDTVSRRTGPVSLGRLCTSDSNSARLAECAIRHVLCTNECSEPSDNIVGAFPQAFLLHALPHVLDIAVRWPRDFHTGQDIRAETFDANMYSLVSYIKPYISEFRRLRWGFFDVVARVVKLWWVTPRTRWRLLRLYEYPTSSFSDRRTHSIPPPTVRRLLQLTANQLRAASAFIGSSRHKEEYSGAGLKIIAQYFELNDNLELVLDATLSEDIFASLSPHARDFVEDGNEYETDFLTNLGSILTAYINCITNSVANKAAMDLLAPRDTAPAALKYHLLWIVEIAICAAENDICAAEEKHTGSHESGLLTLIHHERVVLLHLHLQGLAKLTSRSHTQAWWEVLSSLVSCHLSAPRVAKALKNKGGRKAYLELANALSEGFASAGLDMPQLPSEEEQGMSVVTSQNNAAAGEEEGTKIEATEGQESSHNLESARKEDATAKVDEEGDGIEGKAKSGVSHVESSRGGCDE
ncbi:hypothetical protein BD626DRAFT_564286 [Schizophyllum amplum]|uniref:DUF6535 domain-containing protein n=1 Tax=Schizophyllum amplum TaxID=97359 RepID=A0A550CRB8_9AGAR|nr:hypothetical protein BD626DRAFT_564286 [Auriculariopsis ampla]